MIQIIDMTASMWPSSAGRTARAGAGGWAPTHPGPGLLLVDWLEPVMDLVGPGDEHRIPDPQAYQVLFTL